MAKKNNINKAFEGIRFDTLHIYDPYGESKADDVESFLFGDMELAPNRRDYELWYIPEIAQGSDYGGSDVTLANYEALLRDFGKRSKFVKGVYGSHGSYGIAFNVSRLKGKLAEELAEVFRGLKDYALYDEDHWSVVENRLIEEAWESYIKDDFKRELNYYLVQVGLSTDEWEVTDNDDTLYETYHFLMEKNNIYPIIETGCTVYVDLDEVITQDAMKALATQENDELLKRLVQPIPNYSDLKMALIHPDYESFQVILDKHGITTPSDLERALQMLETVIIEWQGLPIEERMKLPLFVEKTFEELDKGW